MQKKELYHFHIINDYSDKWTIGEKLTFGKEKTNNYHEQIINLQANNLLNTDTETLVSKVDDFSEMGKKILEILPQLNDTTKEIEEYRNFLSGFDDIMKMCSRTLLYYVTYIRELTFEEVRLKINQDLPSRKSCLWVCDEDNIETWRTIWTPNKKYKLFKLSLEGIFHEVDSRMINNNAWQIQDFEKHAKYYWTNKTFLKGNRQPEILFEGNATILEEIS
jgi:hypothetical protein